LVVSRFRLKTPPGISSSCISPLTPSGQRSRASWAFQPQKSATLSPQPGGKPRKVIRTCGGIGGGELFNISIYTWCIAPVTTPPYAEWRKTAQLKLQKVNLNNKEKKNYVNVGLLKHDFQVMAAWRLKTMLEVFTLSFNAGCCTPEQWFEVPYFSIDNAHPNAHDAN